ncbi:hypothetical protein ACHQM5_002586 [Ranunculus cassubicifolius]
MPPGKLIFHSGGEFIEVEEDGSLCYNGGEAHALHVNQNTTYENLNLDLAANFDLTTISIKYFLPRNNQTLITISNDKDLRRMMTFYAASPTAQCYLLPRDAMSTIRRPFTPLVPDSLTHVVFPATTTQTAIDPSPNLAPTSPYTSTTSPHPHNSNSSSTVIVDPINTVATPVIDSNTLVFTYNETKLPPKHIVEPSPSDLALRGTTKKHTNAIPINHASTNGTVSVTSSAVLVKSSARHCVADSIGKRTRSATRKLAMNGLNIVSVTDDVINSQISGETNICDKVVVSSSDKNAELKCTVSIGNDLNSIDIGALADQAEFIAAWKNSITDVGQEFASAHEFRDALRKYAAAHRFVYMLKKNDSLRVTAKCRSDGCPWRIHASWVRSKKLFKIKKINKSHTCENISTSVHPQAIRDWLTKLVKDRLQVNPHYTPKELLSDIGKDFGIQLSYYQAYRGIELAREQLQGSYKDAYNFLPWFIDKVIEMNPVGFQSGCRPLLFLDSTSLRSRYHEILFAAFAVDGNDSTFPVAFCVVDMEDDDNWRWFLEHLKPIVSTAQPITFVSDKHKGLSKCVDEVFENAYHGYSVHHLMKDFRTNLKGHGDGKGSLSGNFLAAAHAFRLDGFNSCMENIKGVSVDAYNWAMNSEPCHWANSQFKGERYNQITYNVMEPFKKWMVEARDLPILQKMDMIQSKMNEIMCCRREDSRKWDTKLTPSREEKLNEESLKSRTLKVLFSSDSVFEVHDDSINVVNIDEFECSCQEWKMSGLPCCHAIAVFNCIGKTPYDYCSKFFMTETAQLAYSETINSTPEKCKNSEEASKVQVHPPSPQQQAENHAKRKLVEAMRKSTRCSRCKEEGHNKASCKLQRID